MRTYTLWEILTDNARLVLSEHMGHQTIVVWDGCNALAWFHESSPGKFHAGPFHTLMGTPATFEEARQRAIDIEEADCAPED